MPSGFSLYEDFLAVDFLSLLHTFAKIVKEPLVFARTPVYHKRHNLTKHQNKHHK